MTDHSNQELINDILGQLSHLIRESMSNMHAGLRIVAPDQARDANSELDEGAAILNLEFNRLHRLAANLAEAEKLNAPPCPPTGNDDIVGLCRRVAEESIIAAQLLNMELEFKSERSSYIIAVDSERIRRLLNNLLSNAFKFTEKGGKITIEVRITHSQVELRVSDTGCGIAPERMNTLFEPYRKGEHPDGSGRKFGLGLPICRKIAQDHGGTLVILSEAGKGTCAVATLANRKTDTVAAETFLPMDYSGGFNRTLLELSDALPAKAFRNNMID